MFVWRKISVKYPHVLFKSRAAACYTLGGFKGVNSRMRLLKKWWSWFELFASNKRKWITSGSNLTVKPHFCVRQKVCDHGRLSLTNKTLILCSVLIRKWSCRVEFALFRCGKSLFSAVKTQKELPSGVDEEHLFTPGCLCRSAAGWWPRPLKGTPRCPAAAGCGSARPPAPRRCKGLELFGSHSGSSRENTDCRRRREKKRHS